MQFLLANIAFLRSFPHGAWFVDTHHISNIVPASMDFCLPCRRIVSLDVQSAGEAEETAEEWSHISSAILGDGAKCSAQGLDIYSLLVCSYIMLE